MYVWNGRALHTDILVIIIQKCDDLMTKRIKVNDGE